MNPHKTLPFFCHELFHDGVSEDAIFFLLHCDLKLGEGKVRRGEIRKEEGEGG